MVTALPLHYSCALSFCFPSPWFQHMDLCSSSDHTDALLILPLQLQSPHAAILHRKLPLTNFALLCTIANCTQIVFFQFKIYTAMLLLCFEC